jgi:hypothetical protein
MGRRGPGIEGLLLRHLMSGIVPSCREFGSSGRDAETLGGQWERRIRRVPNTPNDAMALALNVLMAAGVWKRDLFLKAERMQLSREIRWGCIAMR